MDKYVGSVEGIPCSCEGDGKEFECAIDVTEAKRLVQYSALTRALRRLKKGEEVRALLLKLCMCEKCLSYVICRDGHVSGTAVPSGYEEAVGRHTLVKFRLRLKG
jgi:hypothetical protein